MVVKYSVLRSCLKHSESFENENKAFLDAIERKLGICLQEAGLDDYDADLKLLFVQTGGSEGLFLSNLDKIKEPYYLLTNGGNNSLAASLEIMTYIKLRNKEGEVIHGDVNYIANKIKVLAQCGKLKRELSKVRLGVIGKPSDWLISSIPNEKDVKEKLGISLVDIKLQKIEEKVKQHRLSLNNVLLPKDNILDENDARNVYDAIDEVVKEHNLNGYTIRCFDLLTSIKMTGCLALAISNKEGVVATCEGDIMAMITMELVRVLFNQSSFQANPSRIDTENNTIVFAHCTIPFDMLKEYRYDTHFESGIGLALKGEMFEKDVTILRLSSDLKSFYVSEGHIEKNLNEANLCRTQILVKLDSDVSEILKHPCGNHHIIFYGRHRQEIENILNEIL